MIYNKNFLYSTIDNAIFFTQNNNLDSLLSNNKVSGFSIDTRSLEKNQIFIAIDGKNVDGHNFLIDALKKNCSGLIINENKKDLINKISKTLNVSSEDLIKDKIIIIVPDTLIALKTLASKWRQTFNYPVIGITGSVGKTSTKELLLNIFNSAKIPAFATFKNQNTDIGLSLNILKMRKEHKFAIFEMGISHIGEMKELADILKPNIGIITYISHAHTQGLTNIQNIITEKLKIFKNFSQSNIGIINGDQDYIKRSFFKFPIITFGKKTKNNIQVRNIKTIEEKNKDCSSASLTTYFKLKIYDKKYPVFLHGHHDGLINNALAAATTASFLQIDPYYIVKGIETYKPKDGRFEEIKVKNYKSLFINDSYNASPHSMKAAIKAFNRLNCTGKKIAILGDMLELGKIQKTKHTQIGKYLFKNTNIDHLIVVGKNAQQIAKAAPINLPKDVVINWQDAKTVLKELLEKNGNSLVLLKASHSIGLENIIKNI